MMGSENNTLILTPDAVCDLFDHVVQNCVVQTRAMHSWVHVRGVLGVLPQLSVKGMLFDIRLTDDSSANPVLLSFRSDLAAKHDLRGGEYVIVSGVIRARLWQGVLRFYVQVFDFVRADRPLPIGGQALEMGRADSVLSLLRRLPVERRRFPRRLPLRLLLIYPASSRSSVKQDFLTALDWARHRIDLIEAPVSMLQPTALAAEVSAADADIVAIIRGGGDAEEFAVFDHADVLTAMASSRSFRVLGLGHTNDRTLADLFADHVAATPTAAGTFLLAQIKSIWGEQREREKMIAAQEKAQTSAQQFQTPSTPPPSSIPPLPAQSPSIAKLAVEILQLSFAAFRRAGSWKWALLLILLLTLWQVF